MEPFSIQADTDSTEIGDESTDVMTERRLCVANLRESPISAVRSMELKSSPITRQERRVESCFKQRRFMTYDIDQPQSSLSADTNDDSTPIFFTHQAIELPDYEVPQFVPDAYHVSQRSQLQVQLNRLKAEFVLSKRTDRFSARLRIESHGRHRLERRLLLSATTNNIEMLRIALDEKISPNTCDSHGRTALHIASARGFVEIVETLLKRGADPNCKDCNGNTPLHLAAGSNRIPVITLLLEAGTDPQSPDLQGFNPMQLAEDRLHLLKVYTGDDMSRVKSEAHQVVEMLSAFLKKRKGFGDQVDALSSICSRLTLSNSTEQVKNDVKDLLTNIDRLQLNS